MDIFANSLGISLLYLTLLGIGVLFAILILVGGLDGIDIPGLPNFDLGVDGPDGGVPSLSPVTIASFITAFGAFGLLSLGLFDATQAWSLAWAAAGGVIVAALAHLAFGYFLIRPQGSSEVQNKDIVGAIAEVTAPIPADSVGSVTFIAQGGRVSFPAKSADGVAIARGVTVVIEKATGGVLVVRPQQ